MNKPKVIVYGIVGLLVLVALTQIDFTAEEPADTPTKTVAEKRSTIMEVASDHDEIATMAAAVKSVNLADTLTGTRTFTVFAPSEDAFAGLPEGKFAELMDPDNKERLKEVISYHLVPGIIEADELEEGKVLTTLQGTQITIGSRNDSTTVNGALLVRKDIDASNGIVHVIDDVLLPGSAGKQQGETAAIQ